MVLPYDHRFQLAGTSEYHERSHLRHRSCKYLLALKLMEMNLFGRIWYIQVDSDGYSKQVMNECSQ